MFNPLREARLGGARSEEYRTMVATNGTNVYNHTPYFPDVAGLGEFTRGVGTVGTLHSRHLNSDQWKKDQVSMKQYNQLKSLEETITNPIKNFEDLTLNDICNDNVIVIVNDHFSRIIRQGMVPRGWSQPGGWNQQNPTAIKPVSVMKGVEPLYQILKSAFPSHPHLQGSTPAAWWLAAKGNLNTGVNNLKKRGIEEEYDSKTATLYIVNQPLLSRFKYGRMEVLQKADMFHIMQNLLRSRRQSVVRRALLRAQILISAYAISRGGEVKWCRFSFWNYDGRFCVLDIGWTEIKTGNWYAMPVLNFVDPDKFEVDPIHGLGCACLFDNRLLNRYGDENKDFVFGDLHEINNESVST